MVKKLIGQMLAAQILSALTVTLCLLIDNIMIGRFLGDQALAAYGFASPLLLVIGAVGSMLSAGVQVACGKSLGKGDQEETNVGYASAIAVAAVFSIVFTALAVLLRVPLARVLGAGSPEVLADTSGYIAAFCIGAPASMAALILVPFLQMSGKSGLLITAVLSMTAADVVFDLLNVFVFHGGMIGMGLASAASYYVAILIGGGYFLSKNCVFKFSFARIQWRKIKELLAGGIPTIIGMASSVALAFAVNHILLHAGGKSAVAAFAVINTIMNAGNSISVGSGGVALTLSSVLYHEEDRTGLAQLLRTLTVTSVILGLIVTAIFQFLSPACVMLFIPYAGESQTLAISGLRVYALGLTFCCLSNVLRSCYQGTGRVHRMEVIAVMANGVLPILTALLFSRIGGVQGVWFLFAASECLTNIGILVFVWIEKRRLTLRTEDVLLLRPDYGVPAEDLLECDPTDLDGAMAFAGRVREFCLSRGGGEALAEKLEHCVRNVAGSIISYGFVEKRRNRLSIILQYRKSHCTLRFRDDCTPFDPEDRESAGDKRGEGIRNALDMADESHYTYSMNLNELMMILREHAHIHADEAC